MHTKIITESPAFVKWSEKKRSANRMADKMIDAGYEKRGLRMKFCGDFLKMKYCPDCGKSFVSSANLCRDKLCPTCAWRLSLKRFAEMCCTLQYINDIDTYNAGFLTLTVRNCAPEELKFTLGEMSKAWNRMLVGRKIKPIIKGWARSVEITYNKKTKTFHPHYHIIMLYDPEMSPGEMAKLTRKKWDDACRLDYEPITDFREIRSNEDAGTNIDNENFVNSILETFKYAVKSDEVEQMPMNIFRALISGIDGVRMVSYGGIIKTARQALDYKKDDLEEEDTEIDISACSCGAKNMREALLKWSFSEQQYQIIAQNRQKTPLDTPFLDELERKKQ